MWARVGASSTPQHTTVTTVQLILPIRSWDSIETIVLDGFTDTHIINANNNTDRRTDTMTLQQTREALANMPIEARDELLVMLEENAPQQQIDEILSAWLPK